MAIEQSVLRQKSASAKDKQAKTLTHADDIAKNARTNWFGLLAVYAFVALVLAGVKDVDFFVPSRETQLPLVGLKVPTLFFFYAAPALVTILYVYFQLYLIKHWEILSTLPARIDGQPLGQRLFPWLITDYALSLRGDGSLPDKRPLPWLRNLAVIILVWLAGPALLGWALARSWTRHDEGMSLVIAACFLIAVYAGWRNYRNLLANSGKTGADCALRGGIWAGAYAILMFATIYRTWMATEGGLPPGSPLWSGMAGIDLREAELVPLPIGWLPYEEAKLQAIPVWCDLYPKRCKENEVSQLSRIKGEFRREWESWWRDRYTRKIGELPAIDLKYADLRHADLFRAVLTGADLRWARLIKANLLESQLDGVDLQDAQLQHQYIKNIEEDVADLRGVSLNGANLSDTDLNNAHMAGSELNGANLKRAELHRTDLRGAQLNDAYMSEAELHETDMAGSELNGANLEEAELHGTDLRGAQLNGANMSGAELHETHMAGSELNGANLDSSEIFIADLRGAKLHNAHLSRAQLYVKITSSNSGITQQQTLNTITNASTILPITEEGQMIFTPSCLQGKQKPVKSDGHLGYIRFNRDLVCDENSPQIWHHNGTSWPAPLPGRGPSLPNFDENYFASDPPPLGDISFRQSSEAPEAFTIDGEPTHTELLQ